MPLTDYRTLGRSGLAVSPFALGTMTFGTARWGSADDEARDVFNAYIDAGGNFVDTADIYAGGKSEEMVGRFVAERGLRDRVVLATKFGFGGADPGNPNAGGNGRKQIHRALAGSLERLGTDYVDLYWLHVWDTLTPPEEVVQTLSDLVRAGTIRYYGLSDMPAWYAARVASIAEAQGVAGPVAMQVFYSLAERTVEHEHVPAARELGMGVVPWSPLAYGLLAGTYSRDDPKAAGGRLSGANPFGDTLFTDRNWAIVDVLRTVAADVGRPMAQVALAWLSGKAGVTAPILGTRTLEQLRDNLESLDLRLAPEHVRTLDAASAPAPAFPYAIFAPETVRAAVFGGASVTGWR